MVEDTSKGISLGRPRYHVIAPSGWMNDPCAPGYIPSSKQFTLMYQWNPYSHLWDNISWGQMKSDDLVYWKQVGEEPVFVPDQPYDKAGIFTGCLHPGPLAPKADSKDQVCIFYTSVPELPIHWTKPHVPGREGVACATSTDGGETWQKHPSNPIITAEPTHLSVTGFRDPSVVSWPTLDRLLDREEGSGLYALISGGVQDLSEKGDSDVGPRLFLYDVNPQNLLEWDFLSTLGKSFKRNLTPHPWTGDFGTNWECATVFQLRDDRSRIERDVCILGVEGGGVRRHVEEYRGENSGIKTRDPRYVHWFFPRLSIDKAEKGRGVDKAEKDQGQGGVEEIDMKSSTGGLVDWAELYAFATFQHPDGRRIAWGWLVELDLSDELAREKGWTGCLGLPRQLSLKVYENVKETIGSGLGDIGSFEILEGSDSPGNTVLTLGIEPLSELSRLQSRSIDVSHLTNGQRMPECYRLELTCALSTPTPDDISLIVRADPSSLIETRITFSPSSELVTITRENSSPTQHPYVNTGPTAEEKNICLQNEQAPFTLLRFVDGSNENLELSVFVDRDIIELFVNGRLALATRVYAPKEADWTRAEIGNGWKVEKSEAWEMGSIGLPE